MKRTIRLCTVIAIIALVVTALCSCGSSVAGTWYCADDIEAESPLTLTSDRKFNLDGVGGEYSVENNQVVLVSSWESAILNVSKVNGKTCLVDEDGGIWFNSQKAAHDYYEKETTKRINEVKSYCYGTYSLDSEYVVNNQTQLILSKDHTYKYVYKGSIDKIYTLIYLPGGGSAIGGLGFDALQTGTWSFGYQGTLLDGSVCIKFSPERSSGNDDASVGDYHDWIEKNTPAPFIRNIRVNNDSSNPLAGFTKN